MIKFYSKYKRGDVWFLHMPTETGDNSGASVQKKSRPYLIISCEENNNCAPTFNVVPITTRDNDHLPPHIYYRYEDGTKDGRNQLVLCEQITTIGVDIFNDYKSHYMYSFSLDFMTKVDNALAAQLGLQTRVADMNILENLIDKLAAQREADIKKLREESLKLRVDELAVALAKKFNIDLTAQDMLNGLKYDNPDLEYAPKDLVEQIKETVKERTLTPLEAAAKSVGTTKSQLLAERYNLRPMEYLPKLVAKIEESGGKIPGAAVNTPEAPAEEVPAVKEPDNKTSAEETPKPTAKDNKAQNKWTKERIKEYLDDYAKLGISDISQKWGISKSSVQPTASRLRLIVKRKGL